MLFVEFSTSGPSFEEREGRVEAARILRRLADSLERSFIFPTEGGNVETRLHDSNGNVVGGMSWRVD